MVLNLDVLILENILVNYFLLYLTSQTVRIKSSFKTIILPAAIGGFYVITIIFQSLKVFTLFPFKMLTAFIMILILFRKKGFIFNFKALAIYILYSMLLAGLCFYIEINKNFNLYSNLIVFKFGYKKLLLSLIIVYLLIDRIIIYIKDRKEIKSLIYTVDIINKSKEKSITAFLDTGNELREPATNLPVMIIEKQYIEDFYINDKEKLYIPYKAVDGQGGKLIGFKPEYIVIHFGKEVKKVEVVVAFCNNKLSDINDYHALLSRGII